MAPLQVAPPGLLNPGTSCYQAATLQCLFAVPGFAVAVNAAAGATAAAAAVAVWDGPGKLAAITAELAKLLCQRGSAMPGQALSMEG